MSDKVGYTFYCTGQNLRVKTFFYIICNKDFSGWMVSDDPFLGVFKYIFIPEHLRQNSDHARSDVSGQMLNECPHNDFLLHLRIFFS